MSTSESAKITVETGQSLVTYEAMTDSGDQTIFTMTGSVLSGKSGYSPVVRPNGIVTGRNMLSTHADDDKVTVAAFTGYSKGTEHTVTATTATITRATTAANVKVNSITMASDGSIAVVAGDQNATVSTTRASAGGPPLIPVNSVEIGQIITTSSTAGAITASEINQVVGTHAERFDYPVFTVNNIGDGNKASVSAKTNAYVKMASAMDLIHTGSVPKAIYAQYYTPVFSEVSKALDFVPCENTHSSNSTQYYRGTIASTSSSLGQGSFTALMEDNVTDALVAEKDEILTIKFYPDEDKTPYILTQGKIGLARTFPADNQNQASVTITSEIESAEFSS